MEAVHLRAIGEVPAAATVGADFPAVAAVLTAAAQAETGNPILDGRFWILD